MSAPGDPAGRGLPEASGLSLASRGLFGDPPAGLEAPLHPRTLIRRHVVNVLRFMAGPLASQIHDSRVLPLGKPKLPAILVYTGRDQRIGFHDEGSPRILIRRLELKIEIVDSVHAALQEVLDSHARVVEWLVQREETQGGNAAETVLSDTTLQLVRDGADVFGSCVLTFDCDYFRATQEDAEQEFLLANVKWDIAEPDGQIDAEDRISYEEES